MYMCYLLATFRCFNIYASNLYTKDFYFGTALGASYYNDACSDIFMMCDETSFNYGIYGGYTLAPWISFEGAVNDYGIVKTNWNHSEFRDIQFSVKTPYLWTDNLSTYLKVGVSYLYDNASFYSKSQFKPAIGFGSEYRFSTNWAVKGEYQFINGIGNGDKRADLYSTFIGLTYYFKKEPNVGNKVDSPPFSLISTNSIYLESSVIFAFNSKELHVSKEMIKIVEKMKRNNNPLDTLQIIGYSDSSGSSSYNIKLSKERALAVANYFINSGISPTQITVLGNGENYPEIDNKSKEGRAMNRRVEIYFKSTDKPIKYNGIK